MENDTVPLSARASELLRALAPRLDHDYIFTGPKGEHFARDKYPGYRGDLLDRAMQRAWKKAGIGYAIFHHLRDTFASRRLMSGAKLDEVAALGGWKTIAVLQKHYGHLTPGHLEGVMQRPYVEAEREEREGRN